MSVVLLVTLPLALAYAAFLIWYGGKGKPLGAQEIEAYLQQLDALSQGDDKAHLLASVRALVTQDDGCEFVMQNLVRYRPKALYPPGYAFNDDPRAADQRYGKAVIAHLLRYGNLPVFIARRSGRFLEPAGVDAWHYVAMVRYRSRRDFLRFAVSMEKAADVAVHKWAALEKTHVFPVQPLVSLVFVRGAVAVLLALVGAALMGLLA